MAFLSRRVQTLTPSITLGIEAKAKELKAQGKDIISLSAGEPDFDTPEHVRSAAVKALAGGVTRYTPAVGTVELRQAITEKLKRDQGLTFSVDQIVVSCGAKHSLYNLFFALINEGDEVIIPSPFWLSYPEMVQMLGGKSVLIETTQENGFKLSPEALAGAITPKTKVLVLNSPSNPTGAVYSKEEMEALILVLKKHPQVWVMSDEIYEKLVFDGRKHFSIAQLDPEIAARTIIVNGMSKSYAMTGWRLGYAAIPSKELTKAVASFQSHSTSNPTSFAQSGGVEAVRNGDVDAQAMCKVFEKRRDWFYDKVRQMPGLKPFRPEGAFYLFVDISGTGLGSMAFSERLLEEANLAVVPGLPFGSDRHIRMSFATSEKNLESAVQRLEGWLSKNVKVASAS
ncbi:MAG: aspartate aminotransferase [Omnitrophica bacterium GWA2_52_12]|nr:MAG: aspartate aminotransferase [Omnitrophica bacterium GWA2_52_12]